jgi:hypothetical protein
MTYNMELVVSVADPEPDPEGSETFGRIRIQSGTEINFFDPDSNPGFGFKTNCRPDPDQTPDPKLLFRIRNTAGGCCHVPDLDSNRDLNPGFESRYESWIRI